MNLFNVFTRFTMFTGIILCIGIANIRNAVAYTAYGATGSHIRASQCSYIQSPKTKPRYAVFIYYPQLFPVKTSQV